MGGIGVVNRGEIWNTVEGVIRGITHSDRGLDNGGIRPQFGGSDVVMETKWEKKIIR